MDGFPGVRCLAIHGLSVFRPHAGAVFLSQASKTSFKCVTKGKKYNTNNLILGEERVLIYDPVLVLYNNYHKVLYTSKIPCYAMSHNQKLTAKLDTVC